MTTSASRRSAALDGVSHKSRDCLGGWWAPMRTLVVAVLACCLGVGCSRSASTSRGGSLGTLEKVMQYLPDDAFMVMHIDVESGMHDKLVKQVLAACATLPDLPPDLEERLFQEMGEEFQRSFGIALDDVQSISGGGSAAEGPPPVLVCRLKDDVDVDTVFDDLTLQGWELDDSDAGGTKSKRRWIKSDDIDVGTYYVGNGWRRDSAVWFPDARTMVEGPASVIRDIAERDGPPTNISDALSRRLADVDFSGVLAIAFEIPEKELANFEREARRNAPWLNLATIEDFRAASVEVSLGDGATGRVAADFETDEIAADVGKVVAAAVVLPRHLVELGDEGCEALDAIQVEAAGGTVEATVTMPGKTLPELVRTIGKKLGDLR